MQRWLIVLALAITAWQASGRLALAQAALIAPDAGGPADGSCPVDTDWVAADAEVDTRTLMLAGCYRRIQLGPARANTPQQLELRYDALPAYATGTYGAPTYGRSYAPSAGCCSASSTDV